ncbi:MAG: ABC transporter substrate-binding protein, partial [Candidatus Promineifilaceae bacterium]|nr:ABC transporter substrate-binding protein [Candidatus Promineifilaceae bacterium]
IGVLNPTTGGLALFGEQSNQGIQLYFDNHEIEGVEIELLYADTAGDPQQALDQARRLVEQENVDFLLGLVNSAVAVPLAQYADESETPLLIAIAGARAATDGSHPYVYRTAMANGQQDRPLGWYAASQMGTSEAALFAWDFLVGEERAGSFAETFTAAGGEIVTEQKPPLGTTDYGPFISQVDPESIDVVYAFFAGPGAIAFSQQMREFGLSPDIPMVAPGYYTAGVLGAMGADAEGLVQGTQWVPGLDTAENQAFLDLFAANIEGEAGVYVEEGYLAAEVAAKAIEAIGGDFEDPQGFLDALAGLDYISTAGPFRFDETGQSVRNVYITEVVLDGDGVPVQEIIETIEDVDLEWTADEEAAAAEPAAEAEPATVKIGVLTPTSGTLASNGEDVNEGINLFFDSIDHMAGNTTFELSFADTAANPEQALEQARRLVEQEEIDVLLGLVSSSVAVPLAQFADENQVPLIVAVAGGTPVITGPERSPYVFRTGITTGQLEPPFGWYVATEMGYERAATFAWDFAAGHARADAFGEAFTAGGGEVVDQQFAPLGTTDFGPFIGQINPDEIDVVYAFFSGPAAIAFVTQMNEFGLTPGLQIVGPGFITESEILPSMGPAAAGIVSATHYTPAVDNAANENFIALYQSAGGDLPGTYVESGYLAAQVTAAALEAVAGDLSDAQPFLDALHELEIEGPGGRFAFDERGQGIRNVYIIEVVEDDDGNLDHQLLDTLESVTQDWTTPE